MTTDKLATHERIAAGIIGGSFLLLTLHTFLVASKPTLGQPPPPKGFEVAIIGAVTAPGDYELPVGANLKDLLELAQPTREADLSRIRKQRKLTHGEEIIIPTKQPLTIYLNGQQAQVPKGTRVRDLRLWIDLDPETTARLTSKRVLKDGEQL